MPIFDQGYQHWNGALAGHTWRWLAVARHGVRAILQNRYIRLLLFAAWLPAIALVAFLAVWGLLEQQVESILTFLRNLNIPEQMLVQPQDFRSAIWTIAYSFFFKAELAVALFLVVIVGPNLVSRDLRFNALPLYFSRPLRRIDYFAGKLGIIGFFLAATGILPAVVAYVCGVGFSLSLGVFKDTHRLLWAGALYGLVITVSAGTLMLALSSLSRRSIYVGLAWVGFVFLTLMLSTILLIIQYESERHHIVREGITQWVANNPPPEGIELNGPFPVRRFQSNRPPGVADPAQSPEAQRWLRAWSDANSAGYARAEARRYEQSRTDWRPVVAYSRNLDRIGDWLLDTDTAWVAIGRAFQGPQSVLGPVVNLQSGGRLPPELARPINERLLADRMVWQFPWYWSAGALGGLWLVSAFILTRRVKSLDRLK
jgi:hypothetical protein